MRDKAYGFAPVDGSDNSKLASCLMELSLTDVSFRYASGREVLRRVTLRVASGASLAILGPSGAGKSTLLRIVAGFLGKPERGVASGSIALDGYSPLELDAPTRGRIGVVFQDPLLFPFLRVEQNFNLRGYLKGDTQATEIAREGLRRIGLLGHAHKWPHQLSGGMKTRVALARECLADPVLLLLDEPFGALDATWRASLYSLIAQQRKRRPATLLLVTHDIAEAALVCERALILSSTGEVAGSVDLGTAKPDFDDPKQMEAFLATKEKEQIHILRLLRHSHPALESTGSTR